MLGISHRYFMLYLVSYTNWSPGTGGEPQDKTAKQILNRLLPRMKIRGPIHCKFDLRGDLLFDSRSSTPIKQKVVGVEKAPWSKGPLVITRTPSAKKVTTAAVEELPYEVATVPSATNWPNEAKVHGPNPKPVSPATTRASPPGANVSVSPPSKPKGGVVRGMVTGELPKGSVSDVNIKHTPEELTAHIRILRQALAEEKELTKIGPRQIKRERKNSRATRLQLRQQRGRPHLRPQRSMDLGTAPLVKKSLHNIGHICLSPSPSTHRRTGWLQAYTKMTCRMQIIFKRQQHHQQH